MANKIDIKFCIDIKDELVSELKDMRNSLFYKEDEIKKLKENIMEKETQIRKMRVRIAENCQHEWETDYIDCINGYKLSVPIKYCKLCELTDAT